MALPAANAAYDRCLFPTSKGNGSADLWEKTPVFDQRWSALIERNPDEFKPSNDLVQRAWAILLRNYLHEQVVTFVWVAQKENGKDGTSLFADIVRYDLPATLPFEKTIPKTLWQANIETLQAVQINTAIESPGDQEGDFSVKAAAINSDWFTTINNVS